MKITPRWLFFFVHVFHMKWAKLLIQIIYLVIKHIIFDCVNLVFMQIPFAVVLSLTEMSYLCGVAALTCHALVSLQCHHPIQR